MKIFHTGDHEIFVTHAFVMGAPQPSIDWNDQHHRNYLPVNSIQQMRTFIYEHSLMKNKYELLFKLLNIEQFSY